MRVEDLRRLRERLLNDWLAGLRSRESARRRIKAITKLIERKSKLRLPWYEFPTEAR